MPPPRPRGVGYNTGVASARPSPNTPMSERQQMALLIQMTATSTTEQSRTHVKKNEHKKSDEMEDGNSNEKTDGAGGENSRDKTTSEDLNAESRKDANSDADTSSSKRNFSDIDEEEFEECDDVKKKKRKDSDSCKDAKSLQNVRVPARVEKGAKQTFAKSSASSKTTATTEKEQTESAKANQNKTLENDSEEEDMKMSDNLYSGGLKVPPLKIVIPQQNCSIDTDGNVSRTGKVNASRSAALPYVVSSSNESTDREMAAQSNSPHESPMKPNTTAAVIDEKKLTTEEKNLHRVLRSSHRSGTSGLERSSNNSSPQLQSSSPSPASSNTNEAVESKINFTSITTSPVPPAQPYENETMANVPSPATSSTSSSKEVHAPIVELHPRKRKIRAKNEDNVKTNSSSSANSETAAPTPEVHPHDFPFTNCFQMYLNIRRQIEKKWENIIPVKPRSPQGFDEYLTIKRSYLLSSNYEPPTIEIPPTISAKMVEIFKIQEKERNELYQRHTVEREKLCLNVEQEIIRVHTKAARYAANQPLPYSACSMLKDEEVYNVITPEPEDKSRLRFNGRLLLSWLQDVDDKWEKIKESMVLRHHNEAESLHAVQLMDWEVALKKFELCDYKSQLVIETDHVPIVHVSDDFDLLPA